MNSNNGDSLRSQVLNASGFRAQAPVTMEAPSGSSPFFGWLAVDGFATVRLDAIQAILPVPTRTDSMLVVLKYGANVNINALDGTRLMKRLGWSEKMAVSGLKNALAK